MEYAVVLFTKSLLLSVRSRAGVVTQLEQLILGQQRITPCPHITSSIHVAILFAGSLIISFAWVV
jgi:hypothetical protein